MKRDTEAYAAYFRITVEEARKLRDDPSQAEGGLAAKTTDAPVLEESTAGWYCRNRTDSIHHSFTRDGQKYCLLREKCRSQIDNGKLAKLCGYKKR